jgi:hypothetical protein
MRPHVRSADEPSASRIYRYMDDPPAQLEARMSASSQDRSSRAWRPSQRRGVIGPSSASPLFQKTCALVTSSPVREGETLAWRLAARSGDAHPERRPGQPLAQGSPRAMDGSGSGRAPTPSLSLMSRASSSYGSNALARGGGSTHESESPSTLPFMLSVFQPTHPGSTHTFHDT